MAHNIPIKLVANGWSNMLMPWMVNFHNIIPLWSNVANTSYGTLTIDLQEIWPYAWECDHNVAKCLSIHMSWPILSALECHRHAQSPLVLLSWNPLHPHSTSSFILMLGLQFWLSLRQLTVRVLLSYIYLHLQSSSTSHCAFEKHNQR